MERIDKLKTFLDANPDDPFLKHALALEWIKQGNDFEAKRVFEGILQKAPDYVGSYYHLAKLLERTGERDAALAWYRKGIATAQAAGDKHALNELKAAYEELEDEM